MKNPIVLRQHYADQVLGVVVDYKISPEGLHITAKLTNDIENTFQLIRDSVLRGLSIGFIAKTLSWRDYEEREIRTIESLDLAEISVVSVPANRGSLFTMAKAFRLANDAYEAKNMEPEFKLTEEKKLSHDEMVHMSIVDDRPDGSGDVKESPTNQTDSETAPEEPTPEPVPAGDEPKEAAGQEEAPEEVADSGDTKTADEAAPKDESKTTKVEEPAGEEPATPPAEAAKTEAQDKSEPVEAGEEPTSESPTLAEEAKALITALIEKHVRAMLDSELAEFSKGLTETVERLGVVSSALPAVLKECKRVVEENAEIKASHKRIEEDILNIEVPSKSRRETIAKTAPVAPRAPITFDFLAQNLGR